MINKKLGWFITILLFMLLMSCGAKIMTTESGKEIPKPLRYTFFFLDYSKDISDLVGNITADLYYDDMITEEDRDIIGLMWMDHKRYHNMLQHEVNRWYTEIDLGLKISNKRQIVILMYNILDEVDVLQRALDELTDGKINIPDGLFVNLYAIYQQVKEALNE